MSEEIVSIEPEIIDETAESAEEVTEEEIGFTFEPELAGDDVSERNVEFKDENGIMHHSLRVP